MVLECICTNLQGCLVIGSSKTRRTDKEYLFEMMSRIQLGRPATVKTTGNLVRELSYQNKVNPLSTSET